VSIKGFLVFWFLGFELTVEEVRVFVGRVAIDLEDVAQVEELAVHIAAHCDVPPRGLG
jgi:hypothetical protein